MIYSSRHILEMPSRLLSINVEQWLLLAIGLIVGIFAYKEKVRALVWLGK